jgi:hypothetical protein
VFEDKSLADQAVMAVEKVIHQDDIGIVSDKAATEMGHIQEVEKTAGDSTARKVNV